jgi:hypothetical protein
MDPVKYPADMLANGGPPFDTMGLRSLPGPLADYAALTLLFDTTWKVVASDTNTVVAEGELTQVLEYLFDYGCRVEYLASKANS